MFVDGSYASYGNNQLVSCYNQAINSSNCGDDDSTDLYPSAIRDALHIMSDHLPVVMELQTDQSLSTSSFETTSAFKILGSNVVSDWLTVYFDSSNSNIDHIKVYNTLGQEMYFGNVKNLNQLKINVSKWTSGIYYVVHSEANVTPLKFIKK